MENQDLNATELNITASAESVTDTEVNEAQMPLGAEADADDNANGVTVGEFADEAEAAAPPAASTEGIADDAKITPAPKKRGRPRKVVEPQEDVATEADSTEAPAPKKRGRPRKNPIADADAIGADGESAPAPKKRGRPRKLDAAAEEMASKEATASAEEMLSPADGDVTEATEESVAEAASEEATSSQPSEETADEISNDELSFEEQAQVYSYGDEVYAPSIFAEASEVGEGEAESVEDTELFVSGEDGSQLSFFKEEEPEINVVFNEIPPFVPKTKKESKVKRAAVYNSDRPRRSDTAFDFIELLIISLVAVLILTSFFFRHSKVQGDSMLNTLENGDHLIISDFLYKPQRGDIVVIEDFSTGFEFALVKRVIAVEGDRITIINNKVYVNGEEIDEPYVYRDGPDGYTRPINEIVPKGKIFVLGDHRNDSTDSRTFGFVDEDSVIGKALIRVYPFDKFGVIEG